MTTTWKKGMALVAVMISLIGIGWVMVFSTSGAMDLGGEANRTMFRYLIKQVVATGLGVGAILFIIRTPLADMERWAMFALGGSAVLMLSVFIPGIGHTAGKATRWIHFGPVNFQPVEVFKLAVVLAYAVLLFRQRPNDEWSRETWGKICGVAALAMVLPMLQKDFGATALLMVIGILMVWLAGGRFRYLILAVAVFIALGTIFICMEEYRIKRIQMYLSFLTGKGGGYQARQSLIALGAGGFLGVGPGGSIQKLLYLPSAHADFIFAILGEELGFIGAVSVVGAYVFFLHEGVAISRAATARFPALLCAGMTFLIFLQAMWHIAVVLVLVPTKGLALPFVSYGGSSLISSMMAVGVILRCSREPAATGRARAEGEPGRRVGDTAGGRAWLPS